MTTPPLAIRYWPALMLPVTLSVTMDNAPEQVSDPQVIGPPTPGEEATCKLPQPMPWLPTSTPAPRNRPNWSITGLPEAFTRNRVACTSPLAFMGPQSILPLTAR